MTIFHVSAFLLIHRPYLYFYPPSIYMSSSHQLFIHHNTVCIAYFLTVFFSQLFSASLLWIRFCGYCSVLLVLSIPISVAHVTTQRARSFTPIHVLPQYVLSRLHVNAPSTRSLIEFCNDSSFSTIHRLSPAPILWTVKVNAINNQITYSIDHPPLRWCRFGLAAGKLCRVDYHSNLSRLEIVFGIRTSRLSPPPGRLLSALTVFLKLSFAMRSLIGKTTVGPAGTGTK